LIKVDVCVDTVIGFLLANNLGHFQLGHDVISFTNVSDGAQLFPRMKQRLLLVYNCSPYSSLTQTSYTFMGAKFKLMNAVQVSVQDDNTTFQVKTQWVYYLCLSHRWLCGRI